MKIITNENFYIDNKIISFNESFNSPINGYLKHIKKCKQIGFGSKFNQKLDCLPEGIKKLSTGCKFNDDLNNLPSTLTHLIVMNKNFCGDISFLPESLKVLVLNGKHENLQNLPHIKYLELYYLSKIENLPDSIECLTFKRNMNYDCYLVKQFSANFEIINLPKSLKTFVIDKKRFLIFEKKFNKVKEVLPFVNYDKRMRSDGFYENCIIFTKNKHEILFDDYD